MIIAIDGPAGSGKSTTAKKISEKIGFIHINTGLMYRSIALKCLQENIDYKSIMQVKKMLNQTRFDLSDDKRSCLLMDNSQISTLVSHKDVTDLVSKISAIDIIREKLVDFQKKMAKGRNVVLEGRDIGTVVFPKAEYKFFLVADIVERAKRRLNEMKSKGESISLEDMIDLIEKRDAFDSSRESSPLKKADDAIEIDTTHLTLNDQVDRIIEIINLKNRSKTQK